MRADVARVREGLEGIKQQLAGGQSSAALRSILEVQNISPGLEELLPLRCDALIRMRNYAQVFALATDMMRKNPNDGTAMSAVPMADSAKANWLARNAPQRRTTVPDIAESAAAPK